MTHTAEHLENLYNACAELLPAPAQEELTHLVEAHIRQREVLTSNSPAPSIRLTLISVLTLTANRLAGA